MLVFALGALVSAIWQSFGLAPRGVMDGDDLSFPLIVVIVSIGFVAFVCGGLRWWLRMTADLTNDEGP